MKEEASWFKQRSSSGLGNHEIAAVLGLSEKTVRNNVAMVLTKLQVRDRAALVAAARDRGIRATSRPPSGDAHGLVEPDLGHQVHQ